MVAPCAANWQIKETTSNTTESPRTDVKRLVTIIRKSGYRGYLPIETLSTRRKDYDPFKDVPQMLAEIRESIREMDGVEVSAQ